MLKNYSNVELIHLVLAFIGCLNWFSQPSFYHSAIYRMQKGDMLTPLQLKQCGLTRQLMNFQVSERQEDIEFLSHWSIDG